VTETHRGNGLAEALINHLCAIARERGWTHVRWVTEEANARAQRLYDRIATDMELRTYRIATSDRR
ncbi:MAG TPA: GNAT family N-acetyltransferase, partial [Candidatus Acidoferrum sp.]|nr:GNAT family N-acetyltransferase [Candidatus Acidoferrum sp.]